MYDVYGNSKESIANRDLHDVALISFGRDFGVRPVETLVGRMGGTSQPGSSVGWPATVHSYGPSEMGELVRDYVKRQEDLPEVQFNGRLMAAGANGLIQKGDSGGALFQT